MAHYKVTQQGHIVEYVARELLVVQTVSGLPIGNFADKEDLQKFWDDCGYEWEVVE